MLSPPFFCSFCMGRCLFPFAALFAWDIVSSLSLLFLCGTRRHEISPQDNQNNIRILIEDEIILPYCSKLHSIRCQLVFWSLELQNNHPTSPQNAIPGTHGCERRRQVLSNSELSNLAPTVPTPGCTVSRLGNTNMTFAGKNLPSGKLT